MMAPLKSYFTETMNFEQCRLAAEVDVATFLQLVQDIMCDCKKRGNTCDYMDYADFYAVLCAQLGYVMENWNPGRFVISCWE